MSRPHKQKWIKHDGFICTQEFIDKEKQMYSAHYDNVKTDKDGFVVSIGLPKIFIEKNGKYVNMADETEEVNEIVYLINTINELKLIVGNNESDDVEFKEQLEKMENRLKYLTSTK